MADETKKATKKSFKKGDEVAILSPEHLAAPLKAVIIAFTMEPGKLIGVQFETSLEVEKLGRGHSCDGLGEDGKCLWVTPEEVFTMEDLSRFTARKKVKPITVKEVDMEIVIGEDGKKVLKPVEISVSDS